MSRKDPPFIKNSAQNTDGISKRFGDGSPLRTSLAMSSYQEKESQMPKYDQEGNQITSGNSFSSNQD